MNRFDASTIWNAPGEDIADADQGDPYPGEGDVTASSPGRPEEIDAMTVGSESGWTSSLRAQTFFVPLHYESNYRYPLIVWLHSDGFNENQVCHVMPHVSTRNYLATGVRAPMASDCSGHRFGWSGSSSDDLAERSVLDAINRTTAQFSVHAQRIVLAGYLEGGSMATRIALRNPDRFAAAVSLGGAFELPDLTNAERERLRERRLPMLWQYSLRSDRYDEPALVRQAQAAASIRSRLEIRQYRNDDEMNTVVLSDLDRWIMNHVVSGSPVGKLNQWDTSPTSFSDN
jgi:phospholipase/carboxylesterase